MPEILTNTGAKLWSKDDYGELWLSVFEELTGTGGKSNVRLIDEAIGELNSKLNDYYFSYENNRLYICKDESTGTVKVPISLIDNNGRTALSFDGTTITIDENGVVHGITVDNTLSLTSENAIQNKVVKAKFDSVDKAIGDNTSALATLNGTGTGSVKKIAEDAAVAEVTKVVAGAPASFDTLKEMSDWINSHENDASAMNSTIQTNTTDIATLKSGKVDKVSGKGLSTNDYTTAEKSKLGGLNSTLLNKLGESSKGNLTFNGSEVNTNTDYIVDTVAEAQAAIDSGLIAEGDTIYVKEDSDTFTFKGSCLSTALPSSGNSINDTYYCTDTKCRMTWNGGAWYQSSLSETEYADELASLKNECEAAHGELKGDLVELQKNDKVWNEINKGSYANDYHFILGHRYKLTFLSTNGSITVNTRLYKNGDNLENIGLLNAFNNVVVFTPNQEANAFGGSCELDNCSIKIEDIGSIENIIEKFDSVEYINKIRETNNFIFVGEKKIGDVLFTNEDVNVGDILRYSFSTGTYATYIEFYDDDNVKLFSFGKKSSSSTLVNYIGEVIIPSGFKKAVLYSINEIQKVYFNYLTTNIIGKLNTETINNVNSERGILPQNDVVYDVINSTNDDMFTTRKSTNQYRITIAVDLLSTKSNIYYGNNIYGVYTYDEDGNFIKRIVAPTDHENFVFDFSDIKHRFIKCLINKDYVDNHMLDTKGNISNCHNSTYLPKDVNLQNIVEKRVVFDKGELSCPYYRIGTVEYTNAGTLIFASELRYTPEDNGISSIAIKRSTNDGKSFEDGIIILPYHEEDNKKTMSMGSAQLLVDRYTGRIFIFAMYESSDFDRTTGTTNKNGYNSYIVYKYSDDDGKTWSQEHSFDLRTDDMMILAPSPGKGITMNDGTLVVPAWCQYSNGDRHSLLIYSTNNGDNWTWSGNVVPLQQTNESTVVESDTNGTLIYNMRVENQRYRAVYTTNDLGNTYIEHPSNLYSLSTPICSANLTKAKYKDTTIYLYSSVFGNGVRNNTKLLCTKDFVNWKDILTLTDKTTDGYTVIATRDDIVIVVEEISGRIVCSSFKIPQTVLGVSKQNIPIVVNNDNLLRGQFVYNKTLGKLVFVDENGNARTLSFD